MEKHRSGTEEYVQCPTAEGRRGSGKRKGGWQSNNKHKNAANCESGKNKATNLDGNETFNGCKIRKRHRGQLVVILQFKASMHMHSTAKS